VLSIYARGTDAFDDVIRRVARRLAPHARAAVASLEARQQARAMADDFEADLETKAIIGQAKWILVERYRLTPERAVELMARMSARSKVELRQVAAGLILQDRTARA
jgi:AmiR/NasT family two-component response regulator